MCCHTEMWLHAEVLHCPAKAAVMRPGEAATWCRGGATAVMADLSRMRMCLKLKPSLHLNF